MNVVPTGSAAAVPRTRVLVQAQDPITSVGVESWLRARPAFSVVNDQAEEVDLVVVSAETLSVEVVSSLRKVKATLDVAVVLLLDDEAVGTAVMTAVECNVRVLLSRRGITGEQLATAAAIAAAGGGILPPAALGALLSGLRSPLPAQAADSSRLTRREIDILRLLSDGFSTAEVAAEINFSERAVKKALHDLVRRLDLRNRTHAVAYAVRQGLF